MTPFAIIAKRKSLTRKQRADVFIANDGRCHLCGEKIDAVKQPWQADHVIPRELTGSDAVTEYKPAHVRCHLDKTAADRKAISKATRIRADTLGIKHKSKFQNARGGKFITRMTPNGPRTVLRSKWLRGESECETTTNPRTKLRVEER